MTTVTLDLPQDLYQRALNAAEVSHRPIEQVVVEWIQPPESNEEIELQAQLADLDRMANENLIQIAQFSTPSEVAERLQYLLETQRERMLTRTERHEVETLVYQEELQTLRKAKALYLLKERGALPIALATKLDL